MKTKIFVVTILGAAGILLVVALAMDFGRTGQHRESVAQSSSGVIETSQAPQPEVIKTVDPSKKTAAKPGNTKAVKASQATSKSMDSPDSKPETTRPVWDPQATESESGLEVPQQTGSADFRLPDSPKRKPVLRKSPKIGVAEGKLTKGFPKDAVPIPRSTTIVQSSVARQSELVLVGLEGRSSASVEEVLAFYREHFADRKWLTSETTPAEGVTQLQGAFGQDSTTITVRQLPTGVTSVLAAGVFKVKG